MKYKHLFLDLDDTVFDSKSLYDDAVRLAWHHFRKFNDIKYKEFRKLFLKTRKELKKEFYRQSISHNRAILFMRMLEKLDVNFDAELIKELYDAYWNTVNASIQLFSGVRETLDKVVEAGIVITAVSDGSLLSRLEKLEAVEISHYFKYLVASEEVVKTKPEKEIFDLAIKKSGAKKSEVVFMGDKLGSDVAGGEKYGIDTIWFNPDEKPMKDAEYEPDYVIKCFDELVDVLEIE